MAKWSSTNDFDTRLDPKAPRTGRVTRSTRSQSREVSEAPSSIAIAPPKQKRSKKSKRADLATVNEEDVAREEQLQAEALAAESEAALTAAEYARHLQDFANSGGRLSQHSGMSGTTAKTSFSQEQINELDSDAIVVHLPITASVADEFAKRFLPSDRKALLEVWREIRTPGSKFSKLCEIRFEPLSTNTFGQRGYIQPSFVLRALLRITTMEDLLPGPWRPDSVIHKINLIKAMRNMLIMSPNPIRFSEEDLDALTLLDDFFPAIAGPMFDEETLRMCLAVQTQVAIARLTLRHTDPGFTAYDAVSEVFLDLDEDDELLYKYMDALYLRSTTEDKQQQYIELINQRIQELHSAFREPSQAAVAVATLRARYAWTQFIDQLIQYYEHRKAQLDREIAVLGGTPRIVDSLEQEVQRRSDARVSAAKHEKLVKMGISPRKFGKRSMDLLKAREQERRHSGVIADQSTAVPVVKTIGLGVDPPQEMEIMPDVGSLPGLDRLQEVEDMANTGSSQNVDGFLGQPVRPSSEATQERSGISRSQLEGFQESQRNYAKKAKERARFIDKQPNATRVEWDEASQATQQPAPAPPARSLRAQPSSSGPAIYLANTSKRSYAEVDDNGLMEFDPTPDDGFQTDMRGAVGANERRRQLALPPMMRASTQPSSKNLAASVHVEPIVFASPQRQRRNPGAAIPPSLPPLDPNSDEQMPRSTMIQRSKTGAKQNRVYSASGRTGPQQRQPWSQDEEEALLDLIIEQGHDGISYALLKTTDASRGEAERLGRRSAEDIRFKARNMKTTFVLSGFGLPANWEHVVLDKKAIDQIRARGIPYEQARLRAVGE